MRAYLLTLALLTAGSPLFADSRNWKNADGSQTFSGEYVSKDDKNVTIRRADGKVFTLELMRLSDADRTWISNQSSGEKQASENTPDPKAVFDTLCFGDTKEEVTKKLKESKMVEAGLDETLQGRVGLNGTYRTRKKIGGLQCSLFFDWTGGGTLKEISLQTDSVPQDVYVNRLKATWEELAQLLTTLHGKPKQQGPLPRVAELTDGALIPSHLWELKNGGSALLGTSKEGATCMVVVRFTNKKIAPVELP